MKKCGSREIEIVIEKIKKPDWDIIDGYEFRKDQTNINTYYFIRSSEIFLNNIDKAVDYIMEGKKDDYFFVTVLKSIDKIIKDGNILKHHLTLINDNILNLMNKIRFDIINYTAKSAVSIDFLKDLNCIKKKISKIKESLEE